MALKKNIVLQDNFGDDKQFANAYIKVDSLDGSKKEMRGLIGVYREKDGNKISNQQISFVPNLAGNNFIAQAYEAMKQDARFAGAVDC
jgi:hypothetical protein